MGRAQVDIGDLGGLVVGGDDPAIIFLLQLGDAADMVVMVVGDEDIRQRPALALQRLDDRAASGASIDAVALVAGSWIR
jgi:hypothetical protein